MPRALVVVVTIVALVASGWSGLPARAQDATPAAGCPATTPEENVALVLGFIDAVYQEHDPSRVGEFLSDDFNRTNPGRPHVNKPGVADDAARVQRSLDEFPDLSGTVDDVIASDDKVVVRMTFSGTNEGDFADIGAAATGRHAEWPAVVIWRIECGKLIENWVVADKLDEMRELGIVSDEELATNGG